MLTNTFNQVQRGLCERINSLAQNFYKRPGVSLQKGELHVKSQFS